MAAPIEVSGSDTEAQPESVLAGVDRKKIQGRSLGQIAWLRLKRDKVALTGALVVILLILIAIFGPYFVQDPLKYHQNLIDPTYNRPKSGFWHSGISSEHWLGVEPGTGRDMLARIVHGARISLLVSFLATLMSVIIGTTMGIIAGFFGGWVDYVISRAMDAFLAFPLLLFAIALVGVVADDAFGLSGNNLRVSVLVIVIGFFNWPYIGRIIRGQTLSLREREFVDAARSMGARNSYVLFKEVLPNLVAPILVYSTLLIPTNILFEAALSFLGVGVNPPTPSWGGMLTLAVPIYSSDPMYMIIPGMAIFITVLAFNLFGDGLRDALDPRSR
ncbi:peptide/nickel transport system permease protein/oligopeptide transport system permease protein [Actinomadura pelletieri DSM 43383]|uniref:Peptide/nickel transport system permease protein/oligopeptide transport system permease protein n=1 Tax=Actinomadura pelletieri DSM 43383 TaxID=1120940 RepID=A0A495QLD0_9ACTN|nr:ABC transporter permease [Actinomadura pelletieri]RKS73380.1 peptide/nickel transport system permease protein/oligopeptide transport system permease protein [Actinomadura pelletieri DSM 43383]